MRWTTSMPYTRMTTWKSRLKSIKRKISKSLGLPGLFLSPLVFLGKLLLFVVSLALLRTFKFYVFLSCCQPYNRIRLCNREGFAVDADGVQKVLYGVTAQRILTAKKYVKKTKNTNIKGKGDILILIQLIISHCISV